MKVKKKVEKKPAFDFSKLDPDIHPFLHQMKTFLKHCRTYKTKYVLAESKVYSTKIKKIIRACHQDRKKYTSDLISHLMDLEYSMQDITDKANECKNKSRGMIQNLI